MEQPPIDRRTIPAEARLSTWTAPDGWAHRRLDWLQPKGASVRGSLLFAGGRGDFLEKHIEVYAHWHRRGWNVATFDWRSQGGSRGGITGGHLETMDPLVDDLAALAEAWGADLPGPYVAAAHSMGGHLLLRALAERRPRLDAAVLVAPMLMVNAAPLPAFAAPRIAAFLAAIGWRRRPVWRQGRPPPPAGSYRQYCLTGCPERYEDEAWWWEQEPGFSLGPPSWGWMNAAYRSCRAHSAERLASVETPVLLIGTRRDRLVSAAAIERAAALLPRAELLMFDDAGHEILREADPVRLKALARIDAFLDRHAPAGPQPGSA